MATKHPCHRVVSVQLNQSCNDLCQQVNRGVGAPHTILRAVITELVDILSQSEIPDEDLVKFINIVKLNIKTLRLLEKIPFALDQLLGELLINLQRR